LSIVRFGRRADERFEVAIPETYSKRSNLAPQQRTLIIHEQTTFYNCLF
jgi:hypothetical protein